MEKRARLAFLSLYRLAHVHGESNGSPAVVDGVDHRLSHPKVRVRRELVPSRGIELIRRAHKPAHPSCVRSDSERIPLSAGLSFSYNSKATRRAKFALRVTNARLADCPRSTMRCSVAEESRRSSSASSRRNAGELTSRPTLGDSDVFLDLDLVLPKSLEKTSTAAFAPAAPPSPGEAPARWTRPRGVFPSPPRVTALESPHRAQPLAQR